MNDRSTRRFFAALLLGFVVGCAPTREGAEHPKPTVPMLLPGSPLLHPLRVLGEPRQARVLVSRATGDTTEHSMGEFRHQEWIEPGDSSRVVSTFRYSPPYLSTDSLVVARAGLAPAEEILRTNGSVIAIRYYGRAVAGTVQSPDSAPRSFAVDAPEPPFAFNELEMIVRSLPLRAGFQAVVPLFSEMDRRVEYDTVAVVDARGARWRVRFADSVIVAMYEVDGATRAIVGHEVSPRRGGRFRYVPSPGGVAP
jgi:hypothetical protein